MEKFKNKLIRRKNMMVGFGFIALSFILIMKFYVEDLPNLPEWLSFELEFVTGLFLGLEIIFAIYIIKMRKALNNEEALQQLYIEENDERKRYIRAKAGQPLIMILSSILIISSIIIGIYDMKISFVLLGVVMFQMLVSVIYKLYLLKTI
ncbi:hypothetical protein [Anaerorhabdus sp.]|uniref:hypothetical protein n=1 Tax=Anaerorhabdus sp. TaxID=1872524 RepID=UPI002B1FF5A9|nr:hypothetical protein [Anaerorhabdus sp.]MEA4874244.1 hypothetical protein [Anaerorhabdus sp.]